MKKSSADLIMAFLALPGLLGILSAASLWFYWPRPQLSPLDVFFARMAIGLPPLEVITGVIGLFLFRATSKSWLMILCGLLAILGILIGGWCCFYLFLIMTGGLPHPD